jgi:hypothetical protein
VEPDGGWQWVTGEAFSYTNWRLGEPNNNGDENRIQYFGDQAIAPTLNDGEKGSDKSLHNRAHPNQDSFGQVGGLLRLRE